MNIQKPSVEGIGKFLEESRGDLTDKQFTDRFITGVIASLKLNKKLYRSFGGFWWPLKRMILKTDPEGAFFFGENVDTEINDAFSYQNDALTVCAAFLTQESNIEQGYMNATQHTYYTAENEPVALTIEDEEMEYREFAEGFKL